MDSVRNHETPRVFELLSSSSACIRNSGESCTGTIHRLESLTVLYPIDWIRFFATGKWQIINNSRVKLDNVFAADSHLLEKVRDKDVYGVFKHLFNPFPFVPGIGRACKPNWGVGGTDARKKWRLLD